jgi:hypothetical protein
MPAGARAWLIATVMAVCSSGTATAEWLIRPFVGATFAGNTTLLTDLDHAAGKVHGSYGVTAGAIGEVVGVEADIGYQPGFFQAGSSGLVLKGRLTTVAGNVVVAVPRRLTQYTLRPYVVGGVGLLYVSTVNVSNVFNTAQALKAVDVGAGVTGFLSKTVGLSWDVRHFGSIGGRNGLLSIGPERLGFWRANMSLAFRY